MDSPKVFLDYDQETLDAQYNQRTLVPDADDYIAVDVAESARVRQKLDCRIDVAYGPGEDETLDVFPAVSPGSPVVVYMHGGAWTRSDKANESFMAEAFVEAGAAFVAVNFGLCPKVTLDEMIRQAREAVAWSCENAQSFNADPDRLYIAGHSSGGHVGGMMVVTDWTAAHNLPRTLIKGALLCSGMYDLAPVRLSARNEYLQLDEAAETRQQRDAANPRGRLPADRRLWRRRADGVPPPVEGIRRRLARSRARGRGVRHAGRQPFPAAAPFQRPQEPDPDLDAGPDGALERPAPWSPNVSRET